MGKKKKEINIEEVPVYVALNFTNDDICVTIKNVGLDMLGLFSDKEIIVTEFMYRLWFLDGTYDAITINGVDYVILKRTKKNIELMVKDRINNVVGLKENSVDVEYEVV